VATLRLIDAALHGTESEKRQRSKARMLLSQSVTLDRQSEELSDVPGTRFSEKDADRLSLSLPLRIAKKIERGQPHTATENSRWLSIQSEPAKKFRHEAKPDSKRT
jgi:hypothetical protein